MRDIICKSSKPCKAREVRIMFWGELDWACLSCLGVKCLSQPAWY